MVRNSGSSGSDARPITVRLRRSDYSLLKDHAAARGTSLNSVLCEAVAQYRLQVEREQAVSRIHAFQERLRSAGRLGTDCVVLLRDLREGRGRGPVRDDAGPGGPDGADPAATGPETTGTGGPGRGSG